MASLAQVLLREGQSFARGQSELRLYYIHPCDDFRHWVFDLDAGVDLEEVEILILVQQELDGAGVGITDRAGHRYSHLAHLLTQLRVQSRRRRLLDYLLVAPLDGALAFEELDDVAVAVGQDLELDVARPFEVLLEVDGVVAESAEGLAARRLQALRKLALVANDTHPLAAAAPPRP